MSDLAAVLSAVRSVPLGGPCAKWAAQGFHSIMLSFQL
jgi:hypothetical protein